jgi:uncharacterized repeat protein (TIGR03803 family)
MKKGPLSILATLACLLAATVAQGQTFSVVYNFGTNPGDPQFPYNSGIIAQGRDGNLYGSTLNGGVNDYGAVYRITPTGTLTTLFSFSGTDGNGVLPESGLTLGKDGNFYGATYGAGKLSDGTVFKMTPAGVPKTLYTFTDGSDGALPVGPPVQGMDGNFYGTTCPGCNSVTGNGTIYKITPTGTFRSLYQFDITHGERPYGPLTSGTDGNFYGTTAFGGTNGKGVVFKITPAGKLTVLYNFDGTHGWAPIGTLTQGTDGNFYGTTADGGTSNSGVVFKITPAGTLTVLHDMNGTTDGSTTWAGLVQATDGNFYGVNAFNGATSTNCPSGCGTIYQITPGGVFSVLYNFDLTTGQNPYSTLTQHTDGLLYGASEFGGVTASNCNCGVLYSLNIGAAPFVRLVTPAGRVATKIGILGQDFTSSSVVTFGSVPATAVLLSGTTFLTATVPSGATTGAVTVTTTAGTLTGSTTFRVIPQIKSFSPPSGPVGTTVTITGVSLAQTTRVTFGGVAATGFTVNSDTQVTATVPTSAKTGKIGITTPGGAATSTNSFTVN